VRLDRASVVQCELTRSVCQMDLKLPFRRYASFANGVVLRWETQMKNRRIIYTTYLTVAFSATGGCGEKVSTPTVQQAEPAQAPTAVPGPAPGGRLTIPWVSAFKGRVRNLVVVRVLG
jgi:hypothetical protein